MYYITILLKIKYNFINILRITIPDILIVRLENRLLLVSRIDNVIRSISSPFILKYPRVKLICGTSAHSEHIFSYYEKSLISK